MSAPTHKPSPRELVQALQQQLAETRIERDKQKWLLDQIMQSASWRVTTPLRWGLARWRDLQCLLSGNGVREQAPDATPLPVEVTAEPPDVVAPTAKETLAALWRVQLEEFLASGARLTFRHHANPTVSIVLVLFNRAELTLACLRSILEERDIDLEVIIVDNASSDRTGELLDRLDNVRVIRNPLNEHFLLGANRGTSEARGRLLLLLNNDAQLLPGSLGAAVRCLESAATIGAVGGKIVLLDGTLQEAGNIVWRDGSCLGYGRGDDPSAPMYMFQRDVDYCSGAFLLTRAEHWNTLGGFDREFVPAYYEETDYCTRLRERGYRVVYEPRAVVLHYEFGSATSSDAAIELQKRNQTIFEQRHRQMLTTHLPWGPQNALAARTCGRDRLRLLFIDDRVPHRWLGSGFPRANEILASLERKQCLITLFPTADPIEPWATVFEDIPRTIEVMLGMGPLGLEAFLKQRQGYYDAVIVSRPHNMEMLTPILKQHPDLFSGMKVIYDAEAVFAVREAGRKELLHGAMDAQERDTMLATEIALARQADVVVTVSRAESEIFQRHGIERCKELGHTFDIQPTKNPFESRSGFLFVGAIHEESSPNADSVIWFLEEIFPRIRESLGPEARFTIAGVNRSERVRSLAQEGVRLAGRLPDLTPEYAGARVLVAPTRFAAGIPHKVHEAAARGIPVVATSLLAQQLGWTSGIDLLIADDAASFAGACVRLYSDHELWNRLRSSALARVQQECSPASFERQIDELLAGVRRIRP